jgi:hypothetical protein
MYFKSYCSIFGFNEGIAFKENKTIGRIDKEINQAMIFSFLSPFIFFCYAAHATLSLC